MSEKNKFLVRLMRWGDSSASGRTVTFKLPDDADEHPFKGLPVGAKKGQLVEIEVRILDGDEGPAIQKRTKPVAKPKLLAKPAPSSSVKADEHTDLSVRPRAVLSNIVRKTVKHESDAPVRENAPAPAPARPAESTLNPDGPASFAGAYTPPQSFPAAPRREPQGTYAPPTSPDYFPSNTSGNGSGSNLDAYAGQMGHAAEALAAIAERMDQQAEDDRPHFPIPAQEADDGLAPGVRAVKRAVDLCTAVDKQRAGFFYYMRSLYPEAPPAADDGVTWSRDAKATRDRVCLHCETRALGGLAEDDTARRKFETLETEFERHERLR